MRDVTAYATMSYWTNGMVSQIAHANGVAVNHDKDPNDMARPGRIWTSGAASNWNSGTFQFDGAGNVVKIGSDYNLYDKVSRVATGAPRAAAYTQSYTYDAFGNITQINTNGSVYTTATSTSTNRLTGASYDAAGNVTSYQGYSYYYDPFNQQRQLTGTGLNQYYAYDATGERIAFQDVTSNVITLTARGLDGKVLREYTNNGSTWSWSKDYVWREGKTLAVIDSAGTRHFALDHLGSVRLITNSDTGKTVWGHHAYYPFGEEAATTWDAERIKFTGHERDLHGSTGTLDDLDYMHARYYKPVSAERFFSVDPIGGDPHRPQSWNMYSYVRNNPLKLTDPTGTAIVFDRNLNAFFGWGGEPDFQQSQNLRAALSSAITGALGANAVGQGVATFVDKAVSLVLPSNRAEAMNATLLGLAAPLGVTTTVGKGGQSLIQAARTLGQKGENAVRSAAEIGPKAAIRVGGRTRVPDGLTGAVLTEVKNVKALGFTRQLQDYAQYAGQEGLRFDVWVRPETQLSNSLVLAIESGAINLRFIP